ncbi:hypothetical protein O3Q51_02210 [Cryomorphaceae bacterium 1068]|nr:hypothetical protein [Cryomorphaceae bacterium 1068]
MEKESHLANLITLAKADGIMHPMESLFIQGVAARMGIDNVAFTRIARSPEIASKMVPTNDETRVRHFCELIVLTQVDFMGSDEEKRLLEEIGERMHIPKEKVTKLEKYLSENKLPQDYTELYNNL